MTAIGEPKPLSRVGPSWTFRTHASFVASRTLVGGLLLYGALRAIAWVRDWPRVVDLFTKADHAIYMAQAHRILAGGPLYPSWELAGPFVAVQLPELYPPPTVYGLFVPMSLLPDLLWWLIPLGITASVVAYHRPSAWGWVAILGLLFGMPATWVVLAAGNPSIWVAAAIAIATLRPTFAIAVLIKPTLAPFAVLGVRSRLWWAGLALYLALALAMLPAWLDYVSVLLNFRANLSLIEVPLMLIPVAAWLTRARRARTRRSRAEPASR
jgi:hypothetical protein